MADRRMAVHYLRHGGPVTRIGIAVGRKTGSAVVRNRLKRRLREAAREIPEPLRTGYDLVLLARPPLREASFAEIRAAVAELLERIA